MSRATKEKRDVRALLEAVGRMFRPVVARPPAFPNALGNYPGKRRPAVKPLEPRERFVRLAAHYLSCRMKYRNRFNAAA